MSSDSGILNHLISSIANDDEHAFSKLFDMYFAKVYKAVSCFITPEETKQEVVSDVFVVLWKNRKKLPEVRNFNSFLFIAAKNKALDHLKRKSEQPTYSLDFALELPNNYETNPLDKLLFQELEALSSKSINELPERCKLIFLLSREKDLTYKEIAEILSISEATVNGQMVTAIKKLGKALRDYLSILF